MPIHLLPPSWRFFLFFEALLQRLHQLVPAAQRLDLRLLFVGQEFFGQRLQPFVGDLRVDGLDGVLEPLEHVPEHPVELVEVALVLHQRRAREVVEILDVRRDRVLLQRLDQHEIFLEGDRHVRRAQFGEEALEHVCR